MSVYMTEEEQLEAIKKWWQRYSTLITVVFSLILLGISGYKYWIWHQTKLTTQASNAYEHLMVAFSNQDNKGVRSYANQLIKEYDQTVYAYAARLVLAKLYVAHNHFEKARTVLDFVAQNAPMTAFKQIARIRIARLMVADKKYNEALTELTTIDDEAYIPVINELKGDIFVAMGNVQQALVAYREAMNAVRTKGMGNLYLEMKTNELVALTESVRSKKSSIKTV